MPVSKHRKKGQKKAVKRPGAARARKVPAWRLQQEAVLSRALEMIDFDLFDDEECEMVEVMLDVVLEETMAISVAGDSFSPRIGSRAAVVDQFVEEMREIEDELEEVEEVETLETVDDDLESDEE